ncbi:MAG: 5'-methylthioadenosine/adenosylhomocysteine nucleosidase [Clostridioides sp.]|jgi:adenosylhomocysteine nucleosidase|nr:5'-methylthioadenosine/adenosylhomocysteine nucleosidase [Clostridioides sp.]
MKRIGIIGAMDEEIRIYTELMKDKQVLCKAGLNFNIGSLNGKDVVVVECGIGKVNAALCTQILISEFDVEAVINTGVAGACYDELEINDIVISTDALEHDFNATFAGHERGEIPRLDTSIFKADERLVELAYNASLGHSDYKAYKGRVASGDVFVCSKDIKDDIVETFKAYCVEMEGASIAHVCYLNKIPFVVIRAMSDKADDSAEVTFDEFVIQAAHNAKDLVLKMLGGM